MPRGGTRQKSPWSSLFNGMDSLLAPVLKHFFKGTDTRRGKAASVGATLGATVGSAVGGPAGAAVGGALGAVVGVLVNEASGS